MKNLFKTSLFFFILIMTSNSFAQVTNYEIGDVVDDFTVTDVNGTVWNLYNITSQGKYVYIDFFYDTCAPCQITQPVFNEFYDKYGCNEGDIVMISINNGTDTNEEVIAYENEFGGPFNHAPAVGIEGGCAAVDENFGIIGYPSYLLISPDNVYLHRIDEIVSEITVEAFEDSFPVGFNPTPMQCTLNVSENLSAIDCQIFPNPSDGNGISIVFNNEVTEADIAIYNVLGSLVYADSLENTNGTINPNLAGGTYIIHLQTNLGAIYKRLLVK